MLRRFLAMPERVVPLRVACWLLCLLGVVTLTIRSGGDRWDVAWLVLVGVNLAIALWPLGARLARRVAAVR
jgi:hypothetical protein